MIPILSINCISKIDSILSKAVKTEKATEKKDHVLSSLDATITAKIVRAILNDLFPNVTFRVRTDKYSMGSSVDVFFLASEADSKQVEEAVSWLTCKGFDGMTDNTYYKNPVQIADWTLAPLSYISVTGADPDSWLAKEYNL